MKRRRRRAAAGDSLELLLDTICNTFGGIVFIALLIVLLLRETGIRRDEPSETLPPAELETLAGRLEAVNAELVALRTAQADLARRAAEYAPAETRDLLERRGQLEERTAQLRADRDATTVANATASAAVAQANVELDRQGEELREQTRRATKLETELRDVRTAKAEEIRNPVVRQKTAFRSIGLVVRYGRMYVWHRYDASGNRAGLNTDEFVVVESRSNGLVTRPDPTKGVPLSSAEAASAVLARLHGFRPGTCYFEIIVRPDSFEQFAVLRDALIGAGYEYRLMPTDDAIVDRGGSDGRVQ